MPDGTDLNDDLLIFGLVGPDMGKGGIAAEQLAAAHVHDAAADRVAKLKPDGIEASEQGDVPGMGCSNSI